MNLQETIRAKLEKAVKANLILPKDSRASVLVKLLFDEIIELNNFKSNREILSEINEEFNLNVKLNSFQRALNRAYISNEKEKPKNYYLTKKEVETEERKEIKAQTSKDWVSTLEMKYNVKLSPHFLNVVRKSGLSELEFEKIGLTTEDFLDQTKAISKIQEHNRKSKSLGNQLYN